MATLKVRFDHAEYSDVELAQSVECILDDNELSAMATVRDDESHIHTAFFVYDELLNIYFLSQPGDIHSVNVQKNSSIAVAVWGESEEWGEDLVGVQIFGTCEEVPFLSKESVKAMKMFIQRFPAFKQIVKHPGEFKTGVASRVYVARSEWLKVLDEPRFGRRNYITVNVIK